MYVADWSDIHAHGPITVITVKLRKLWKLEISREYSLSRD